MSNGNKRYQIIHDFLTTPLMLGMVNVYQICDLACGPDYAVADHRQICHEITYVAEGEGTFLRNGQSYRLSKGDLFLVRRDEMHAIRSSRHHPLRYLCMGFTFNRNHGDFSRLEPLVNFYETFTQPVAKDRHGMYDIFAAAVGEINAPGEMSGEIFEAMVRRLLIHTYRCYRGDQAPRRPEPATGRNTNPLIYEMTRYMDHNLSTPDCLGQMGSALGYSYSYLSRLFSQTMGSTLRQYYNQRRFEQAARLLEQPYTLSVIAEMLGFADAPTFCKAFKRYYKLSPGQYRKRL